ncbi:hypothetical protein SD37_39580 [Amycolatopsis orientalis]|uniref:Uncharacterized protein n=1 Tax=Amycolatopsis orientalis TaxID=31958 RepID=A0A193C9U0_AMYOR|nr:hypothetical protein [Amycolatopsis orientalis]ANN21090.1 hypothetical protein SD37_39580 [Amycolatopsis orientalis]
MSRTLIPFDGGFWLDTCEMGETRAIARREPGQPVVGQAAGQCVGCDRSRTCGPGEQQGRDLCPQAKHFVRRGRLSGEAFQECGQPRWERESMIGEPQGGTGGRRGHVVVAQPHDGGDGKSIEEGEGACDTKREREAFLVKTSA